MKEDASSISWWRKNAAILRQYPAPLLSALFAMVGTGFFQTYITLWMEQVGKAQWEIGLVHSGLYLGLFVGALTIESFIIRVGHIQALAAFSAIWGASIIAQALFPFTVTWVILRFFAGISMAAFYVILETWMLDKTHPSLKGSVLATYMTALYGGQAVSQQILNVIDLHSDHAFLIATLWVVLSAVPVALSTRRLTGPDVTTQMTIRKISLLSPFGSAACFTSGIVISALYSFLPSFALDLDLSASSLVTSTIIGGLFLQGPIGHMSNHHDRRKILLGTAVLGTSCAVLIFLSATKVSTAWLMAIVFLTGGFSFTLYPLSINHMCDQLTDQQISRALGTFLVIYGAGSVLGPLICGSLTSVMGSTGLFALLGLVFGCLALIGGVSATLGPEISEEQQSDFEAVPRTSPVALEISDLGPDSPSESDEQKGYERV